jgi:hypothetical protein
MGSDLWENSGRDKKPRMARIAQMARAPSWVIRAIRGEKARLFDGSNSS